MPSSADKVIDIQGIIGSPERQPSLKNNLIQSEIRRHDPDQSRLDENCFLSPAQNRQKAL